MSKTRGLAEAKHDGLNLEMKQMSGCVDAAPWRAIMGALLKSRVADYS